MGVLLSGSAGQISQFEHYKKYIGALVYVKSHRSLGYIINPVDIGLDIDICRLRVWTPSEYFATFIDDINLIQLVTGSLY